MYFYNTGTSGSRTKQYRTCGGKQVYCDGNCTNCSNTEVIFSNKNSTHTGPTIHIVRRPGTGGMI